MVFLEVDSMTLRKVSFKIRHDVISEVRILSRVEGAWD